MVYTQQVSGQGLGTPAGAYSQDLGRSDTAARQPTPQFPQQFPNPSFQRPLTAPPHAPSPYPAGVHPQGLEAPGPVSPPPSTPPYLLDPSLLRAARHLYRQFYEVHPDVVDRPMGIAINRYNYRGKLIFGKRPILLPQECLIPFEQIQSELY